MIEGGGRREVRGGRMAGRKMVGVGVGGGLGGRRGRAVWAVVVKGRERLDWDLRIGGVGIVSVWSRRNASHPEPEILLLHPQ